MLHSYLRLTRQTLYLCLFLPIVVIVCSKVVYGEVFVMQFMVRVGVASLASLACCIAVRRWLNLLEPSLQKLASEQAKFIDDLPNRWVPWAIVASACGSLALELAIIRWQGTVWEIFAFYKNFGLLSCFAGLGLGYALAKRDRVLMVLSLPLLALQMLLLVGMRHGMASKWINSLMATPVKEQLNMGFANAVDAPHLIAVYFFLAAVMLLTALAFVPVGQLCGRLLERTVALKAYGLNLVGSIIGTLLVMALSLLWTPPIVWLAPCFAILLLLQAFNRRAMAIGVLSALVAIVVLAWPVSFSFERVYSPYQLLERGRGDHGLTMIRAGGHYYQRIHDLSTNAVDVYKDRKPIRDYYELPYRIHPKALRVAVVGAGTGNDVAAALRRGVAHVDAIEIDPAIMAIGALYHPESPYYDYGNRVTLIINDARTFMRATTNYYDLIVYGLLDSHTLLSHASSVRLDSFVYTVEGIRDAKNRLVDDGIVSLSFSIISPEIGRKIYLMMEKAFDGRPPLCIRANYDGSVIFIQSKEGPIQLDPSLLSESGFSDVTQTYANTDLRADISTDDWPFFYMPQRTYPISYVWMMALILFVSVILFWNFVGDRPHLNHAAYFFMGAGFMLIETKAITELGLMFGNTWQVIGIVILAVLVMAYLGNLVVMKFGFHRTTASLLLLLLSLGVGLAVAKAGGMPATPLGQLIAVVILTVPMFFSGMAFSSLLASTGDIAGALSMNILGAMCGGLLEYNSMYFGFQFLYLIAMGVYAVALVSNHFVSARR